MLKPAAFALLLAVGTAAGLGAATPASAHQPPVRAGLETPSLVLRAHMRVPPRYWRHHPYRPHGWYYAPGRGFRPYAYGKRYRPGRYWYRDEHRRHGYHRRDRDRRYDRDRDRDRDRHRDRGRRH